MEKFSVKKPFTVLVAVVMILILGFVAVTKMDTNLLPNVNTPYLMVVTVSSVPNRSITLIGIPACMV